MHQYRLTDRLRDRQHGLVRQDVVAMMMAVRRLHLHVSSSNRLQQQLGFSCCCRCLLLPSYQSSSCRLRAVLLFKMHTMVQPPCQVVARAALGLLKQGFPQLDEDLGRNWYMSWRETQVEEELTPKLPLLLLLHGKMSSRLHIILLITGAAHGFAPPSAATVSRLYSSSVSAIFSDSSGIVTTTSTSTSRLLSTTSPTGSDADTLLDALTQTEKWKKL